MTTNVIEILELCMKFFPKVRSNKSKSFLGFIVLNLLAFMFGKSIPARTLMIFALVNVVLLIVVLNSGGQIALWSLLSIGLFNSIMWSNIFTLAIDGLGKYTSQGSSLLVMMILGGAIIPLIQGGVADNFGVHLSFIVPIAGYLYLIFYGWKGYKKGMFKF
jgi:FHS family L-fucose permease-like MFS transporter